MGNRNGSIKGVSIDANDLRLVSAAPPPADPRLAIGDYCRLNSGSPPLLVVDEATESVVVSFPDGAETTLRRAAVRRA